MGKKSKDFNIHLITSSVFKKKNAELRLAFRSGVFFGTQAFFLNWPLITMSFIDSRCTVSCVHLGMVKAFANKLDFFAQILQEDLWNPFQI